MSSNDFSFAPLFGLTGPFEANPPSPPRLVRQLTDFEKLVVQIAGWRMGGVRTRFNPADFAGSELVDLSEGGPTYNPVDVPYRYYSRSGMPRSETLQLKANVNTVIGEVDFARKPIFWYDLTGRPQNVTFYIGFPFADRGGKTDDERYALIIYSEWPRHILWMLEEWDLKLTDRMEAEITDRVSRLFPPKAKDGNPNMLDWIYERMPPFALNWRSDADKWVDLSILNGPLLFVDAWGTNEELAIINLLESFSSPDSLLGTIENDVPLFREVVATLGDRYIASLIVLLQYAGMKSWTTGEMNRAPWFQTVLEEGDMVVDEEFGLPPLTGGHSSMNIIGYCFYDEEKKLFDVGKVAQYSTGFFPEYQVDHHYAWCRATDPVRAAISDEVEVIIPAALAEYFTLRELDRTRRKAVLTLLSFVLPSVVPGKVAPILEGEVYATLEELIAVARLNRCPISAEHLQILMKWFGGEKLLCNSATMATLQIIPGKTVPELVSILKILDNPLPGSLTNYEARIWYSWQKSQIPARLGEGLSLEERARAASDLRNLYRTQTRAFMKDRYMAAWLEKHESNLTFEKLFDKYFKKLGSEEDAFRYIINSSSQGRDAVDEIFQLIK